MNDSDDTQAAPHLVVNIRGDKAVAPHEYRLDNNRKEEPKIPSQDFIDFFSS
jgi:hypothetical protein